MGWASLAWYCGSLVLKWQDNLPAIPAASEFGSLISRSGNVFFLCRVAQQMPSRELCSES